MSLSSTPTLSSPSRYSHLRLWMSSGAIYGRLLLNYANCVSRSCLFQYTRSPALFELDVLPHLWACISHHSLSPNQPLCSFWSLYVCLCGGVLPGSNFLDICGNECECASPRPWEAILSFLDNNLNLKWLTANSLAVLSVKSTSILKPAFLVLFLPAVTPSALFVSCSSRKPIQSSLSSALKISKSILTISPSVLSLSLHRFSFS